MPDLIEFTSEITVVVNEQMGSDRNICNAARASTLGEEAEAMVRSAERDEGLIKFLMKNKHGSPFEMGAIQFIVTAPTFVWWNHVRHRIGVSYNIESSRYRALRPLFWRAEHARTQVGKPGAYRMDRGTDEQTEGMHGAKALACFTAWGEYQRQIEAGIALEQAMEVLPMSTMISAYVQFNPRSLMHFLELRHAEEARGEIQTLASHYAHAMHQHWPVTYEAFRNFGQVCP